MAAFPGIPTPTTRAGLLLRLLLLTSCQVFLTLAEPCIYPDIMWRLQPTSNVSQRTWFTEIIYSSNSRIWVSRKQIVVRPSEIIVTPQSPGLCENDDGERKPCITNGTSLNLTCLENEGGGTYRVTQTGTGYIKYACLRVVRRNSNLLQVWTARPADDNAGGLCDDESLIRNEWPWIAEALSGWEPCPYVGGYAFRAFMNEDRKKMCFRIWKSSRLESECAVGEGLQFTFPEKTCSFFSGRELENSLQCWAVWDEDMFKFVLASEGTLRPQFILRFPHQRKADKMVHMYFSPVCPLDRRGIPPGDVTHVAMRMGRIDPNKCYDENSCAQFARQGRCRNTDLHQYGNQCKRSCGLCEMPPSAVEECRLPLHYHGEYIYFESDRKERVTINSGKIEFSLLGSFICKSKHWEEEQYKLLSIYENGCHSRYTCIAFEYDYDLNLLKFRISKSSLTDKSFDMCTFKDDVFPLGGSIRSSEYKTMYPVSSIREGSCGLSGLIKYQATFSDGRSCVGTLSDWAPFSCTVTSVMSMEFLTCKNDVIPPHRNFRCEAFIDMGGTSAALITREKDENNRDHFNCWLIEQENQNRTKGFSERKWKKAYLLTTAQCGLESDRTPQVYKPTEITFQIYKEPVEQDCVIIEKGSTPKSSTVKYTFRKSTKSLKPKDSVKAEASKTDSSATDASSAWRTVCVCVSLLTYFSITGTLQLR